MVYALLTDETTGTVLLVRRRGSALWTLPSGEVRPGTPADDLLTAYCQRQTGISPEFTGPLQAFALAGIPHLVAMAHVVRTRAGARGRIEAISWVSPTAMPTEMDPVGRVAVATILPVFRHSRGPAIETVPAYSATTTSFEA